MMDYHIHPNYSIDAAGTIDEYCEQALRVGLNEIAFTTHLDTDGKEDCFVVVKGKRVDVKSSYWFEDYEASIRKANEDYQERGLKILVGVEVDCYPRVEEHLPERFFSTDFDIILGSVHLINHIAISDERRVSKIMESYSLEDLGREYYTKLLDSLDSRIFDVIAHIDLYRRFGERHYGSDINTLWKSYISDIIQKMKKYDIGFEVNTSSWRKGMAEPMPSNQMITALFQGGIKNVITGSDAHTPSDIGADIKRALNLLFNQGYTHISKYVKRESISVPIR
ncbi:histidinol-phosphatase HisJ family protein [Candidatus Thorarchaeota archaeon]|nr:MAG: histidinol-phosphatase HisJ family protein [Candidatus Thorarchaeota archaeon]